MLLGRLAPLCALLAACSGSPEPTVPIVPEPAPAPPSPAPGDRPADVVREREAEPAPPLVVGWPGVPAEPDADARRAVAAALADHRRGDFTASEAGFRAVVERAPTYVNARYDLACALSRLGRLEEAAAELTTLITADLPAIGDRLEVDEDLAALRASPSWAALARHRTRAEAAFRSALESGVAVVRMPPVTPADPEAEHRHRTIELGVWVPSSQRFVPIAPPATGEVSDGVPDLAAAVLDRERGVALVVFAEGSYSESEPWIPSGTAIAYRAGDGHELGRIENTDWAMPVIVHALLGGLALEFTGWTEDGPEARPTTRVVGDGSFGAQTQPRIVVAMDNVSAIWPAMPPPDGVTLAGTRVTLPGAPAPIALDRAHARRERRGEWWAEDGDTLWLLTGCLVDGDWRLDAVSPALSRISRASGTASLVASAETGPAAMVRGGDGHLYAQVGDRVLRLGGAGPEPLPADLFLSPRNPADYGYPPRL